MAVPWTLGEARRESLALVNSVKQYAIFLLDADGRVMTWNEGARLIKQYADHEIIGQSFSQFFTPEDLAAGKPARLLATAASEGRVEEEGWRVRKDGSRFWADVVLTAIRDDAGEVVGYLKVTRDLSDRKAADDALRLSEQRLAATLHSIGDGVIATDREGRITRLNAVAERLTGWTQGEAVGRPLHDVFRIVNEQTRASVDAVDRVASQGPTVGLANHTLLIARDGSTRPIADSGSPIRGATGDSEGVVVVFRDISDDRVATAERERAVRAEHAVRERDVFLSVAAHELRTPLTALQLKLEGLEPLVAASLDAAAASKATGRLRDARRQTARLGELVERLLEVSRIAAGRLVLDLADVDLRALVVEVVAEEADAARAARSAIHVIATGDCGGRWDRVRLTEMLAILITNALKYGAGKPIDVEIACDSDVARVSVIDHGIGIALGDAERIFAPFERAAPHQHYAGLGLGLYIARGIAEAHGGTIAVASELGHGARFDVELPRGPR